MGERHRQHDRAQGPAEPHSCPERGTNGPTAGASVLANPGRLGTSPLIARLNRGAGEGVLCGETVRSCRKVPDPRDLGGRRPLFYLVGLFSHLNQIKQLVTWSQSALSTIASPDLPGILQFTVRRLRGGGLVVREPVFVSQL